MTARVLNPVVLTEFCKMRASPSAVVSRNLPCGRQLNRVKRDLFGPANPIETTKIFKEELEKHQEKATKKWGFDFRVGSPLCTSSQFVWERVSFNDFVPEMYTLSRAAHVRQTPTEATSRDMLMDERAERANFANTSLSSSSSTAETDESCDESQDESMLFKVPAVVAARTTAETTVTLSCGKTLRKRQPKITEYMKERKRLVQTPKKVSPAKRMRTSSGSSSSSSSSSTSTSTSSTFFSPRSMQRNH